MSPLDVRGDPEDPVAAALSVAWAIARLESALAARRDAHGTVIVAGSGAPAARPILAAAGVSVPDAAEALALVPTSDGVLACGADGRGLTYALLELVDRVEHGDDPEEALRLQRALVETPANKVRSVARLFCSEVEDKPWFHNRGFWDRYLSMLAGRRFNRFSLTLGLGYNYHWNITDGYLYFAYPFLVEVPGHRVRVPQVPDEERERNLAMLRYISEAAVRRGLDFQLGLWTHAYSWIDSPNARHTVEGLTPDNHADYGRDAVRFLLETSPGIGGVTFRIHGESGVPEESWQFWSIVFDGVAGCGRRVGIDLHAKGLDEPTLRAALATGLPVTVSPKFWAEHMGPPYHQAAIRESERPVRPDPSDRSQWHRHMKVSEGSRPFTRYGYGDFLREDRGYEIVFRLWPGTQRVLLWGDPACAAGYGRAAGLAGADGIEWMEPLTFKGREGTGSAGSRTGLLDPPPGDDWVKYEHTYRLFGRLTYNPDASSEVWIRSLQSRFGISASTMDGALAAASRILPLVTAAHHPGPPRCL